MSTTVYSGPVFDMVRRQFNDVADHLSVPKDERDRLLYPKRAITVSCPIHRDDGRVELFQVSCAASSDAGTNEGRNPVCADR